MKATIGNMSRTILLVHKEERVRDSARKALELAAYRVIEAKEFSTDWKSASRPAVIVLPLPAARIAREWLCELSDRDCIGRSRLIVWVSRADLHEAVDSVDFGADDFLGIPFDDAEL